MQMCSGRFTTCAAPKAELAVRCLLELPCVVALRLMPIIVRMKDLGFVQADYPLPQREDGPTQSGAMYSFSSTATDAKATAGLRSGP